MGKRKSKQEEEIIADASIGAAETPPDMSDVFPDAPEQASDHTKPVMPDDVEQPKKRGRKKGSTNTKTKAEYDAYVNAAAATSALLESCLVMSLGNAWRYDREKHEDELIKTSLTRYYEEHGIKEVSPGFMVLIALAIYATPRMTTDATTQKKVKSVSTFFGNIKKWFKERAKKNEKQEEVKEEDVKEDEDVKTTNPHARDENVVGIHKTGLPPVA